MQGLGATLELCLRVPVGNFCKGPNNSIGTDFCNGFIDVQTHADTANDGSTLHVSRGAASEEGGASSRVDDVFDPTSDRKIIKLYVVLFYLESNQ